MFFCVCDEKSKFDMSCDRTACHSSCFSKLCDQCNNPLFVYLYQYRINHLDLNRAWLGVDLRTIFKVSELHIHYL